MLRKVDFVKRDKLKSKMIEKNLLMYDLAKLTGVTSVQVSRIVNGHSKGSVTWWEKAAKVLSCEVSEIL